MEAFQLLDGDYIPYGKVLNFYKEASDAEATTADVSAIQEAINNTMSTQTGQNIKSTKELYDYYEANRTDIIKSIDALKRTKNYDKNMYYTQLSDDLRSMDIIHDYVKNKKLYTKSRNDLSILDQYRVMWYSFMITETHFLLSYLYAHIVRVDDATKLEDIDLKEITTQDMDNKIMQSIHKMNGNARSLVFNLIQKLFKEDISIDVSELYFESFQSEELDTLFCESADFIPVLKAIGLKTIYTLFAPMRYMLYLGYYSKYTMENRLKHIVRAVSYYDITEEEEKKDVKRDVVNMWNLEKANIKSVNNKIKEDTKNISKAIRKKLKI